MEQLGVEFDVVPADVEELEEGDPVAVAEENARRKAAAIAARPPDLVVGVDTVVALDGRIYGKPADEEDAAHTLRTLGGRTHEVISGLAVGEEVGHSVTRVTFRPVTDDLVRWYVSTGEWRGRAGGYAIQGKGAALVTAIDGDYLNVVGLPVAQLLARIPGLVGGAR
ncbi:MAG: Maf family protein [Actinomycetota bacterium]|nr:Maf family protein [Actinomycetota bacterium]